MISEPLMAQHLADRETLAAAHTARVGCGCEDPVMVRYGTCGVGEGWRGVLHPANDEWSLLRALLYDNGRRSERASRHPSDGSVKS